MPPGMGRGRPFDKPQAAEYHPASFRECGRAFGVRARLGQPAWDYRDNKALMGIARKAIAPAMEYAHDEAR
jgi:hypothetical protein